MCQPLAYEIQMPLLFGLVICDGCGSVSSDSIQRIAAWVTEGLRSLDFSRMLTPTPSPPLFYHSLHNKEIGNRGAPSQ